MSALPITITTAGYAALVNAENTGTDPVLITQIGITATGFVPSAGLAALPGEIKRLTTFAGAVVANDTIHVTIRDDGTDVYSLRGFALYLEDGTLFASYGQAAVILEKSSLAMMLLATDIRFANIDAALLEFGDTNWVNPPATTEVKGVVELATPAETITGADDTRATTSAGLKAALDSRFGAGAPSAFFKPLLALATAALIRTALEIKSAALKDEGAGNGLDADLLDGQQGSYYLAWANLTGKPGTFAPSAHTHSAADITSGTLVVARGGTGMAVYTPGTFIYAVDAGTLGQRTPSQVLSDIGGAPLGHVHAAADITSGVLAVARGGTGLGAYTAGNFIYASAAATLGQYTPAQALAAMGGAPLAGPTFTGVPDAPTAAPGTNTTQIATTAFVAALGALKANVASPTFTGVPAAPTAAVGTNTTQLATCAFVQAYDDAAKANLASPTFTGTPAAPTAVAGTNTTQIATTAFVAALGALKSNLASPAFTGVPTAPTAAVGTNTTQLATCAFVQAYDDAAKANLASPTFTGIPAAPTAAAATNTTQIATTAFVQAAIAAALVNYLPKANPIFTGTMTGPAFNKP